MMVHHLALANLFYLSLILQCNLGLIGSDAAGQPWLPGIALVVGVVSGSELSGLFWACALGIGVDSLSIHRLGVHTVVATSLAAGLMLIISESRPRGLPMSVLLTFVVSFLWLTVAAVIHGFLEAQSFDFSAMSATAFTRSLSTALVVAAVMILARVLLFFLRSKSSASVVLANRWTMLTGR